VNVIERFVPVPSMSADGAEAFSRILDSADPAQALQAAITVGEIPYTDRPAIIAHLWTRTDSPTENLGEEDWVHLFRTTGFFSYPPLVMAGEDGIRTPVNRPSGPVTLYRGSTEARARRMSWALDAAVATALGRRHSAMGLRHSTRQPSRRWPFSLTLSAKRKAGPSWSTRLT